MPATQLSRIAKVSSHFSSDFKIGASVGEWSRGAKNVPSDVETVQLLLQYVAQKRGRKDLDPLGIDGKISRIPGKSNTVKAILAGVYLAFVVAAGLVAGCDSGAEKTATKPAPRELAPVSAPAADAAKSTAPSTETLRFVLDDNGRQQSLQMDKRTDGAFDVTIAIGGTCSRTEMGTAKEVLPREIPTSWRIPAAKCTRSTISNS